MRRASAPVSHRHTPGAIPSTVSEYACIDLVNSRFADHTGGGGSYDRLDLDEWRRWFFARCGFTNFRAPSAATLRQLRKLRALLRQLLETGAEPDADAIAQLNRYLLRATERWEIRRHRERFQLRLGWTEQGWAALMATVVASYAALLTEANIDRVRVCANPDCSFMFYDGTRNASRRWCDAAICGNLLKVRRYRTRT